ncbi:efflux transporter, RND family, MFP subunit [Flammeovirgaceae bacterium 311]|nr:efflux transporter, RND family, MFP subunit [Flammeovirgaceae bacterium 311]
MKDLFQIEGLILVLLVLGLSCSERRSEQAQGEEVELAGDEPDETAITSKQTDSDYNPADTVVTVNREELQAKLHNHLLVLVNTYLKIGEGLMNNNTEEAKAGAEQLVNVLQRHEQENIDLNPEVKSFYTNAAHTMRQSAENILIANEMWEIRSGFSAMAPAAYKLAKVADFSDLPLYYQYCGNALNNRGAYWLSRNKEIHNPYADQDMKDCGETVAVL